MEKFITQISDNIPADVAKLVSDIMPMGHICVCYLGKDKEFAQRALSEISQFEYKITQIEYPDDTVCNEDTAQDIVNCDDDARLFLGIGGRTIVSLMGKACEKRAMQYAIITDSPFLYGVGYALTPNRQTPIKLLIDKFCKKDYSDYARCIGAVLAHRVALWEKKYVFHMLGIQQNAKLKAEETVLSEIIGDGNIDDKDKLFDGIVAYAQISDCEFRSSVEIAAELIEYTNLTFDRGESLLLAAIALVKYFKAIMSIEEYRLIIPADTSVRCRSLSKLLGADVSELIGAVKNRKFEGKWLYIHTEYREDMLKELEELDGKLINIIKSAKRFMPDVGYHFGDDYDSDSIIKILYNLSPLTHECSPIAIADALLGDPSLD